ncbi:PREDICTED: selenocysteine insertion sequence-binding protein 2 [Gekko japonicus]|uniref:Selenocysteine insertion sequence-binding protein 2 n=1 Tax=Gekko japonicus TaxID=146911 RepID=A0ABM1JSZ7_GEKJA|nr:PREDICTED: selenocysteine insertion sequence-binding protein 2 [Gekko japonicus]
MTSEREASNEGIKLSAEVKPFVPKYTAVTVAWSEPSEACVFPRYYTTCYPYVQEPPVDKQQEHIQDAPWDTTTSQSQYASQSLMGCSSLREYSSSCSLDAAPNICIVPRCSSSQQDRNYVRQTSHIRKEAGNIPRRRPKHEEPKLDCKRPEDSDSSCTTTGSLFPTALHGKSHVKSDRHDKAVNSKYKHIPNTKSLPEPDFEITLSDFPKLQSLGSNDLLELQKCTWWPLGSAEGDTLPLKSTGKPKISASITKEGEVSVRRLPPERISSSSSDTGTPQVSSNSCAKTQVSWATVLSQTPKRIAPSPSSVLARSHSGSEGKVGVPEDCKSETRENASDSEAEDMSEKKKKKKKKKKAKSNSNVEKLHNENILVQDPPRIEDDEEFPDLAAATDKNYKLGTPKFCCSVPATRDQAEVILTRESEYESNDGYPHNLLVTPKPEVLIGRQPSSSITEKRKTQGSSKSSRKKSQIPVQLDLGGMLAALEQKQHAEKSKQSPKPVVLSVGSAVTLPSRESTPVIKSHLLNQAKVPHNPLDSTSPSVKKGKQREVPKAKKPTSLKKIILKEREQRKHQHLLEQTEILKDEEADQQCTESTPEDQLVSQDTKAETAEEPPVDPAIVTQSNLEVPVHCVQISGSSENSLVPTQLNSTLPKIHSRRFRDYCTQVLSKEVDSCVTDLLKELVRFQDRQYQKDPVKAKTKRRLVMGLREVLKHLKLKKLKCVIISPNCEKIQSKGGLDETLHLIIDSACEQNIPFVFALNRKALGRCLNKAVPVSVVGIFSYDGAQDCFHKMVELTMEARLAYKEMIATLQQECAGEEKESDCTNSKINFRESNLQDAGKAPSPESDEEVPNYIKIWKRKLEEEYNPYVLELENRAAAETLTLGFEELQ